MFPQSPGAEDNLGYHCAQLQLTAPFRTAEDSLELLQCALQDTNAKIFTSEQLFSTFLLSQDCARILAACLTDFARICQLFAAALRLMWILLGGLLAAICTAGRTS